ncbi:MAG TPA: rhodanese-like domain-containing protein [Pirellulaceae bacterium]|nr:rhodanese-like domain-containing protein [Pirellulaceae bacterium]
MLLKYFYDPALAHASYLVGCQRTGEAVVVDPGRDVQQYLDAAKAEGMRLVGVAETHIHADYVSGARELADQHGAKLFVSDEGPAAWKYEYAKDYPHQLLKEGDTFSVGNIDFEVVHTPGHTPESISFLVTDRGGGAKKPMGMFTGDFIFVGSIGRPDLLEKAAGMQGTADAGAHDLFRSVEKFKQLPDYLQIWPAHGAGSACGKGLGAIPSSTVGYEKMYNPGLQISDEQEFVEYILADQPEAPKYFAVMKRVNKVGPAVLGKSPLPGKLSANEVVKQAQQEMVIDTGSDAEFANGHVPKSISIPQKYVAAWAGWLVDYERPVSLISTVQDLPEAVRVLRKIGIDNISGYFDADEVAKSGARSESFAEVTPEEIAPAVENGNVILIDVRGESEWKERHIEQAQRCFLAKLPEMAAKFSGDCTLVFQCRSGGRSAIAASLAQAAGVRNVKNLKGGIVAWHKAGLPVVEIGASCGPDSDACTHEAANQGQAVFWNAQCPV